MNNSRVTLFLTTLILSVNLMFAQDIFIRSGVFDLPGTEPGGVGEIVAGVDFDGDGLAEIYAINDNWNDTPEEMIPRLFKFEKVNGNWEVVWQAELNIPLQNTWPAMTYGDVDKDGKMEIIIGPVNNLDATTNPNPPRIVVFEAVGDGSDNLGVSDGAGNWLPNSQWNMDLADMTNMRPFRWFIKDIDNDGIDEIIFSDRAGAASPFQIGVVSVDNIPDNGDGSETWTLEFANTLFQPGFVRSATIEVPEIEVGGFGEIVSGVDLDGDGKLEIYAVNDNWNDTPLELVPRIYKYEWNGAYWEIVWSAVLDIPLQNTWPALAVGDLDEDGKMEVIWGPVNNISTENPNPSRIVVFEVAGDSSDVLGVPDGNGNYLPNAEWTIVDTDAQNERPFKWVVQDIDLDGKQEIIFGARAGNLRYGVVSVDIIPDNGDGSETWTLEASALSAGPVDGGTIYDIAVVNDYIYLLHSNGDVTPIKYEAGVYTAKPLLLAKFPGGSWKSSSVVDIDKDGVLEFVVGGWNGSNSDVYLAKPNGDTLDVSVIGNFTALGATYLNGGSSGDIDGDGKVDFIFGSRTAVSDPNGSVYRLSYLGGDITSADSYEESLVDHGLLETGGQFDIVSVADLDGDGVDEVAYSGIPRSSDPVPIGIIKYQTTPVAGNNKWDLAIVDNVIYLFDQNGIVHPVQYLNDQWQVLPSLSGVAGGLGSFKGSVVTDVDGDGVEEIVVGTWFSSGAGKVYLLKPYNGGLQSNLIADLADLGAVRLNGAAAGDIDDDGYMDFVFGSRASGGGIFRVEYRGGDITDINSYVTQKIDEGIIASADQLDIVSLANLDDDKDLEVVYSGIPRSTFPVPIPIVVLDVQKISTTPIAEVKIDADGDYILDNLGQEFTIVGVVTSINPTATSNRFSYYIQDATGAINITKGGETGGGPVFEIGSRLQVTGVLGQFRGLSQLEIANLDSNLLFLGAAAIPAPLKITLPQLLSNPEFYEGMLVQITPLAKTETSPAWPAEGSDANMIVTDGIEQLTLRIDKDTDIDGSVEPVYPISVKGNITQYSSASTVYNDGYQLSPNFFADISGNVPAPPSPYYYFSDETRAAFADQTVQISSLDQQFVISWTPAVDLNNDPIFYQLQFFIDGNPSDFGVTDQTTLTLTGQDVINALGGQNKTVQMNVRCRGLEETLVSSVDTLTTTFDILVSVDDESFIPKEFFVDQNYPNPFNPTTSIKFGLPSQSVVDLRIYDILGREVAVLINNQNLSAGTHTYNFDAKHLSSGTYIYRISTGNNVVSKKMLLIK